MSIQNYKEPVGNKEGYKDTTAFQAIKNVDQNPSLEEIYNFHELLDILFSVTRLAGFEIVGRVVLKDQNTGRIWR